MATKSLLSNMDQRIGVIHANLLHLLEPLEEQRLKVKKRSKLFWLISFAVIAVIAALSWLVYSPLAWGLIAAIIVMIIVYCYWVSPAKTELHDKFDMGISPRIIAEFLSEPAFNIGGYIDSKEYFRSDIFRTGVDRYSGNNYVGGVFGDTSLNFSKLHTEYKTETRTKNGGTKTTWHTIFRGIFLIADSNKRFEGKVFIFPDSAERMFGGIGRWMQEKFGTNGRGELVYLEDPNFEKRYVVYASDPIQARYLLTPTMQQCFVELADTFGKKAVHASFVNGSLHVALSGSFDLFSLKMNKPLHERDTVAYYVQNLVRIISVVEILDLNTRIWGK